MNISILDKLVAGTGALLFSMSVLSSTPDPTPDPDPVPAPCEVDCDFTRGPDPTASYMEAESGPYSVSTVPFSYYEVSGFGGGTIHYPTNTTGTMGAIAIVPGFLAYESSIAWWGHVWPPMVLLLSPSRPTIPLMTLLAAQYSKKMH